ncbi:MAG: methyltransferase domain-containing protein [Armatimonadia bacterium]
MASDCPWWQVFFDSADSLILSRFPSATETRLEIEGLKRLVPLQPEDRIADVCCGMGRHLLPLVSQGYQVVGLDRSPMMLALAHRGAQAAGLQARLVLGDSSRLPFRDASLDVVLNLFNSFGYFEREEDDRRVLAEAARALKPGGRFLLDTRNKKHQILFAPYHEPMRLHDGRELIMRCAFSQNTQRLVSRWYDANDQSRLVHEASIRLYAPAEIEAMLEESGLRVQARYGDYEGNEFEGWERQLLFVCHRA